MALEPGDKAVIMVTEFPKNLYRLVTLVEQIEEATGRGFVVVGNDYTLFQGHEVYEYCTTKGTGRVIASAKLVIARWKLRPLKADDLVYTAINGIEYVKVGW